MYMGSIPPAASAVTLLALSARIPTASGSDEGPAAWVTVDRSTSRTLYPTLATISGTPTLLDTPPHDLTASIFTVTDHGHVLTQTMSDEVTPTANPQGGASFAACKNTDGPGAPWCTPHEGESLFPGTTYYLTWDPAFFPVANTSLMVQGNYFNASTGAVTSQAFQSDTIRASWGFWAYTVDKSLMLASSAVNISLQLATLVPGSGRSNITTGPTVLVTDSPTYHQPDPPKPTPAALYIGLPTILGFVAVCLVGGCIWNRGDRHIPIVGSVMGRGRRLRRLGLSKAARQRRADERIQLMEREVEAGGGEVYHDRQSAPAVSSSPPARPREKTDDNHRDSACLGSLAGSPIEERKFDFQLPPVDTSPESGGGNNTFRDELKRQAERDGI